jgi:hypothetical protein
VAWVAWRGLQTWTRTWMRTLAIAHGGERWIAVLLRAADEARSSNREIRNRSGSWDMSLCQVLDRMGMATRPLDQRVGAFVASELRMSGVSLFVELESGRAHAVVWPSRRARVVEPVSW